jgi:hypothetical protein
MTLWFASDRMDGVFVIDSYVMNALLHSVACEEHVWTVAAVVLI